MYIIGVARRQHLPTGVPVRGSDHDQRNRRVHSREVVRVRGDYLMAQFASMKYDVNSDDVRVSGRSAQMTHCSGGEVVERRNANLSGIEQPRKSCLPCAATPRLGDDPGGHMQFQIGLAGPLQQGAHARVASLDREQRSGIERQAPR